MDATVRALLAWWRTLRDWPEPLQLERRHRLPDATPFVSLYAGGELIGCYGTNEGSPATRLAKAFLAAAHDPRSGRGFAPDGLVAQIAYLRGLRAVSRAQALAALEPGRDGVGLVGEGGRTSAILLPQVARDGGLDAEGLLARIEAKAGLPLERGQLYLFATDEVVVRPDEAQSDGAEATDAAMRWLAGLVDSRGAVTFAVDGRTRRRLATGPLHHGRTAVLVTALGTHRHHCATAQRAGSRLLRDVRRALDGHAVPDWPVEPDRVAATLALAVRAGLPLRRELTRFVSAHPEIAASPWHASQCVAALGREAPAWLWRACVEALAACPWAPWTAIAAAARGDGEALLRASRALIDAHRSHGPHEGGAGVTRVPEVALTAVSVEALAALRTPAARAACARGRRFLRRNQLLGRAIPAPLDPALVRGAFRASPISDHLRVDICAHAVLALGSATA